MKKFNFLIIFILSILTCVSAVAQDSIPRDINYSAPRDYEIGGIKIVGAPGINEQLIVSRSGLSVGDVITIPSEATSNAVRRLWETSLFSDVQLKIEKQFGNIIFLVFEVQERPRLSSFQISGVKKSTADELSGRINLRRGDPVTEYDKNNIRNIIDRYYIEKGYLNNDVDIIEKVDTAGANQVVLFINIDRGQKVRIANIDFIGNDVVTDRKLKSTFKETKEKTSIDLSPENLLELDEKHDKNLFEILGSISFQNIMDYLDDKITLSIFKSSKFQEQKFEADKDAVIAYYNSLGYRDAAIISDSVYKINEDNLGIKVIIDEGPRYYFRDIKWEGNSKYPESILSSILNIEKGDVYNQQRLQQKLFFDPQGMDVSSLYMDDGYLFFNVTPQEVNVENDSIDIVIKVYEGPQATINKIIIKGNDKTNEHVIRRELRTLPGNKFSRSDLIRSQREIGALGFFDPEQIGITPIPSPEEGTVDIEYTVVEKSSDQLELSAGWGGTVGGIYGSAGISFNNFSIRNIFNKEAYTPIPSGDGQALSFRLQTRGRALQSYTFSFTEPWLGGKKPNSLTTSFNYTLWNPALKDKSDAEASFIITRGGTVSYGKRLKWPDDFFVWYSSLNYQNYYLRNFSDFEVENGSVNNLAIKQTIARNSTAPNPLFPTSGSNVSLSVQLTPPYSLFDEDIQDLPGDKKFKWLEYHKWRFNAEWYTALAGGEQATSKKLVLKAAAKFGFIGAYNEAIGVSPFERFRVGGDGLSGGFTLYGYDIISLRGTNDPFLPVGARPGGNLNAPIFNKFSVELRYPFSLSQSSTIYALTFLEGGNSYADFNNYNPFNLRKSAGVGVRLFLPMFGLLGFDYGIELDKNNLEGKPLGKVLSSGAFHFKLGFEPE